jgi:hypothetical protein
MYPALTLTNYTALPLVSPFTVSRCARCQYSYPHPMFHPADRQCQPDMYTPCLDRYPRVPEALTHGVETVRKREMGLYDMHLLINLSS